MRLEEGDRGDVTESVELASGSNDVNSEEIYGSKGNGRFDGGDVVVENLRSWRIIVIFLCEFFLVRRWLYMVME